MKSYHNGVLSKEKTKVQRPIITAPAIPINAEEEALMARAINTMPENQEINQQTLPRVQGLRMPGAGVNPVDYSNLFPFDPLGNLISQRKENV